MSVFACRFCNSPSIRLSPNLRDEDDVHCNGCGRGLGSWMAFKRHVRSVKAKRSGTADGSRMVTDEATSVR